MFVLPSFVKARVGRGLYRAVMGSRRLVGSTETEVVCTREGIHWHLNLNEALELGIYVFGAFEPDVRRAADRILTPGMIALDVGANVGSHALYMGRLVGANGRVYAFEPTRYAVDKLTRNIELNRWARGVVVPVWAFVGDAATVAPKAVYSSWDLDHLELGHPDHGGHYKSAEGAAVVTIDSFVREHRLPRVDLIKIDVDGYDTSVVRGAAETLERFRPHVLLELCQYVLEECGTSVRELIGTLGEHGYTFRTMRLGALPTDLDEIARGVPKRGIMNVVGVPPAGPPASARPEVAAASGRPRTDR